MKCGWKDTDQMVFDDGSDGSCKLRLPIDFFIELGDVPDPEGRKDKMGLLEDGIIRFRQAGGDVVPMEADIAFMTGQIRARAILP